ncbi:hypothetical protein [Burkholderia multivorans]|uniref:hypothetical protein n=1 Tax=Burkholderia multivorans TaxID=87883 RepID=UPI0021C10103|nr:hypothetical protein [Burkholderia multivorans]
MVIDLDTISRWLADPCTRPGAGKPECARHYHERAPRAARRTGAWPFERLPHANKRRLRRRAHSGTIVVHGTICDAWPTRPRTLAIDAATARRAAAEPRYKKSNNYCM